MSHKREENLQNTENKKENEETDMDVKIEWDARNERRLFYAMEGLKPVGVNRHFMMICIHQRFSNVLGKEIPSKVIWDHLESSLYDMAVLHESEILPFPNKETDYELPVSCYDLAKELHGVSLGDNNVNDDDSRDSKSDVNSKNIKKQSSSKTKQNGNTVSNSKNTFLAPTGAKSTKLSSKKSEIKPSSTPDNKTKTESHSLTKANKAKRSSSPFTPKNSRSEVSSSATDESAEPPSKKMKTDNTTPITSKKSSKTEVNNSSKKTPKQEINSGSKQNKAETLNSGKKTKTETKDTVNKKNKTPVVNDSSTNRKSLKSDSKKSDQETPKRLTDLPASKQKTDRASSVSSRGSKHEDSDSSVISGSRKSSPAIKGDTNDKKKKAPLKRRRT